MPELPEVETVRRVLDRVLKGKRISKVEVVADSLVFSGNSADAVHAALEGREVTGVGRHGKYFWLEFKDSPWVFGHLGMSGWVRELGEHTVRLREHGNAPLDDTEGRPRHLKLLIEAEGGRQVALTDGRRLARVWISENASKDDRLKKLGPDMLRDLPAAEELHKTLMKRSAPIKALLLDQKLFAGVGNWIADEVLYQAKIAPKRLGSSLKPKEVSALREAIRDVITLSVNAGADSDKYPQDWLFHHRWGGSKGKDVIGGNQIVRETVGGRTSAWVPKVQK